MDAIPYFYHRIELPGGIVTPGWAPLHADSYRIPADLTGLRVLDLGSWDGYWSFEALKRGAKHVTAIEDFSDQLGELAIPRKDRWRTFDLCRDAFGYSHSQCSRYDMSVYDVGDLLGQFDVIFCFGVLYHLRHPLWALEKLRKICTGTIHIETAVLDNTQSAYSDYAYSGVECCAEFFPGAEYGKNPSNWHVGTLRYWAALVQAAGFRDGKSWLLTDTPADLSQCRGFIEAKI